MMAYQPYLVGDNKTALETDKQPWLIPDDAQSELFDGYVEHGIIQKRDGYNFFANGQEGGMPYCESRIVKTFTIATSTGIGGGNQTFVFDTSTVPDPVRRGGIRIISDTPAQLIEDDGAEGTKAGSDGTIDTGTTPFTYTTFPTSIQATFDTAPTGGTVTIEVDQYPGDPVMMVANYITASNVRELIVADTKRINRWNSSTNRLDDITQTPYTGDESQFFSWVQYPTPEDEPRLIFTNNEDPIQSYIKNDTPEVTDFSPGVSATAVTNEAFDTGDGGPGPYGSTVANPLVVEGSITISEPGGQSVTDDGFGALIGDGTGTVNYETAVMSVTFTNNVASMDAITIDYSYYSGFITDALLAFNFKDRLILLRTTEGVGTVYPQRIRISGTGQSGDIFYDAVSTAPGAGLIDIPDQDWIMGAVINRDDLIIFTERSTWIMKYTGSDIVPFSLDRVDGSRGNAAPFAPISYLNMSKGYSPQGIIITDGYQVKRYDERIPDYMYQQVNQDKIKQCFSGSVDDDQNHYLIHPSPGATESDRILVNNYDENNFSVFRIPLSSMGQYKEGFDTTWNDLTKEKGVPDWAAFGTKYSTWNNIGYTKDQWIGIGGGHEGEIWRLNADGSEDNPLRIYAISDVSSSSVMTVKITSDWHNYKVGDYIYITGTSGSVELNNTQGFIPREGIIDDHNFHVEIADVSEFTPFTSGGNVSRTIPFSFTTKNFNPFANQDMKVRCGWVYFYLDIGGTLIEDADDNVIPAKINVDVFSNDSNVPTTVYPISVNPYEGNMTNADGRISKKKWFKMFINQTSRFIQFRVRNTQAGVSVKIHAIMPGFMPVGRLI